MKNLTLIKKSPCIQLGHLYEHIYSRTLISHLFDQNIFEYIDYDLTARTYHGGIIYVDMNFHSKDALRYASEIQHIQIPISETSILEGFSEIESEKQAILSYTSMKAVADGLHKLQEDLWQPIDDIDFIDTKNIRRKTKPLFIAEGKLPRTKNMSIDLTLDPTFLKTHRNLLPLFREIALLVGKNLQSTIVDSLSIYSQDDSFTSSSGLARFNSVFATYPEFDVNLKGLTKDLRQDVYHIRTGGGFDRLIERLQNLDYRNDIYSAPNVHTLYKDTIQIIGSKGWQKIATKENYELLINHISLEVKFGQQKASSSLLK